MNFMKRISYFIEGVFISHPKMEEAEKKLEHIHKLKNDVSSSKIKIEMKNVEIEKLLKKTTAYKIGKATGRIAL